MSPQTKNELMSSSQRHNASRSRRRASKNTNPLLQTIEPPQPPLLTLPALPSPPPNTARQQAALVIAKHIEFFHYTLTCPMMNRYKRARLDRLKKGKVTGTLHDWFKEAVSTYVNNYVITASLKGKVVATSLIRFEFYDGTDRWVQTRSGSFYKLGTPAKDGVGCVSVSSERTEAMRELKDLSRRYCVKPV